MYTFKVSTTALGSAHEFIGPGLSQFVCSLHFQQTNNDWAVTCYAKTETSTYQAEYVVMMLHRAYEAGRESMAVDIRNLLAIK